MTQFLPAPFEKGSFFDVVFRFGRFIVRSSDFPESAPENGGQQGWCPVRLSFLVMLQSKHGWKDRETVTRATVDLQVKACLSMGVEQRGPSQSTLCRHRQLMQELGLDQVYNERLRDLLEALELVGDEEAVLVDSVPIAGAGQQLDSYNLLAAAIRRGLRELAHNRGRKTDDVAEELGLTVYLQRSVKGRFDVNWEDGASRQELLERLVNDALLVRGHLRDTEELSGGDANDDDDGDACSLGSGDGQDKLTAAEIIDKIIEHDVEFDSHNQVKGVQQKAADDRIISQTDPQMRHGRKSASNLFSGFKAQIIASVMFGFIVMVRVIKANRHDGRDLPSMADELRDKGLEPCWWGGDQAYGTLANHSYFDDPQRGELVARMPRPVNGGRFTKDEFHYHFESATLRCPGGCELSQWTWAKRVGRKGRLFEFPAEQCRCCPHKAQCVNPKAETWKGRTVFIVDKQERLIRKHIDRRGQPEFLERLSHRPDVERVIAGFAQCGGKKARRFGMNNVAFDANLSALTYNLRRLGSLIKSNERLERQMVQIVGRFGLLIRWFLLRLVPLRDALVEKSPLSPLLKEGDLFRHVFGAFFFGPGSESCS